MAFVLRDWLIASESLPLEGIGLLHWERRPAYISESDATVYPAKWTLSFSAQSDLQTSDVLFERLACFSRLPVSEIKQQYHAWLDQIKSAASSTDVFGLGSLSNVDRSGWSWSAASWPADSSVSLDSLPVNHPASIRTRWNGGVWLVLIVSMLAAVFIGLSIKQKGCTPEIGSSMLKTEIIPDHSGNLPYQEIR